MAQPARAPVLSYDQIAVVASELLARHHPEGTFPIPIEEIVELKLGIRVYPCPGLRAQHGIEGYISRDLKTITVDLNLFEDPSLESRYRFTLAHELAHHELHQDLFASASYSDINGYKKFCQSLSEENTDWYEWQGFAFAGLVLVPRPALRQQFDLLIERAEQEMGAAFSDWREEVFSRTCMALQRQFGVSPGTLRKRLKKDGIQPLG